MNKAIEVINLAKRYGRPETGTLAVNHINFEVYRSEVFGFLGPNGAGKTTTQRMLTTLLAPSSGRILVNGYDLARQAYPAKRQMGLVPEESNVYTELTAWDNLLFTAQLYRTPRNERAIRAQELLETFGLWEKRKVKAENFSKGMRRRLCIAMAIIHRPTLLFLDEPTPGLDAQSTRTIQEMIRQLNAAGTTVFLTTHQIEEANQLCDRVAIIDHGQIAAVDTPERLKQTFQRMRSVTVALEPNDRVHGQALAALPGVSRLLKSGDKWRLYTDAPSSLIPQVVHYAEEQRLRLVSLNTAGPSLEDVFLEITGREIGPVSPGAMQTDGQTVPAEKRREGRG